MANQAGAYPRFQLQEATRSVSTPLGWAASPSQGYPIALTSPVPIYKYTWVERDTVGVKCRAQEHNSVLGKGSNPDLSMRAH